MYWWQIQTVCELEPPCSGCNLRDGYGKDDDDDDDDDNDIKSY
jgi:hypothetical protein